MSCHLWQAKHLNGKCLSEFSRIYATSSKNSHKTSAKNPKKPKPHSKKFHHPPKPQIHHKKFQWIATNLHACALQILAMTNSYHTDLSCHTERSEVSINLKCKFKPLKRGFSLVSLTQNDKSVPSLCYKRFLSVIANEQSERLLNCLAFSPKFALNLKI